MCDTSNITVGTIVMVKVGRNEIEVVVTEITANGWKVKKVGSDREFIVTRIERVIAEPEAPKAVPATEPEAESAEPEEEVDTPNPAPESGGSPEKKLSLLNAALLVLKRSRTPLNTKEILAQVIEEGLWSPNGAKTPEQSLYSCPYIFPQISGLLSRFSLAYRIFHAAEKNPLFPRQHHLFLLQMQMLQNQRNKPIFIIAISCINHWLSTNFMALYTL